ncbi:MAG: hypothetical protein DMG65_06630 [Candidatus Angelobacter sp. Gp1-AA117]|nr:MAG: hypothetical protein DMG65_06630 [Candidatus Angelobacter sp. Gp1-AA117]
MFGGGAFKAAWNMATSAAKSIAAGIATGVQIAVEAVQAVGTTTVQAAKSTAHITLEAEQWAQTQTIRAAKWAEKESVAAARASTRAAEHAYKAARTVFTDVVAGTIYVACAVENELAKDLAAEAAQLLSSPQLKPVQDVILGKAPKNLPHDGETVGKGCKEMGPGSGGVVPQCPNGKPRISGKLTYVNGIMTSYPMGDPKADQKDGICKTMQKLANATCAEIVGVYNATGGMRADIGECLTNIAKNSDTPAVDTLQESMYDALTKNPPQEMTIYAHSQGGLITQEALADLKNRLRTEVGLPNALELMHHLSIKSFGTAEQGWPSGPNYEQFTNYSDPVPGVIAGAQENYPDATFRDNALVPAAQRHYFVSPHVSPIDSHSMDNVYINEMVNVHGQPNCCG